MTGGLRDRTLWVYLYLRNLLEGERGAATAEYALILALVVVALITVLTNLGGALTDRLQDIIAEIQSG